MGSAEGQDLDGVAHPDADLAGGGTVDHDLVGARWRRTVDERLDSLEECRKLRRALLHAYARHGEDALEDSAGQRGQLTLAAQPDAVGALEAQAETAAEEAAEFLAESAPWAVGEAMRVLGDLRLSRGDLIDVLQAESDYFEAGVSFVIALTGRDMAEFALMEQTGDLLRAFPPENEYADALYGAANAR